jgi:outer membrane protein OmpA-like peptidoglycan-associated protein/tetratricopeptide (TPR) repeat protein
MDDRKMIYGISHFFRMNFILLLSFFLLHSANLIADNIRYTDDKSKDIKLIYRLANIYFETRDYRKADQYYDSVINISPRKYPLAYYRKGIACMNLEKYDIAKESFTKFKKYYGKKKDKFYYKRLAAIYSASSDWAKKSAVTNGNIIVTHQGKTLNHSDIDFSPFPIDDNTIIYGAVYSDNNNQLNPVRQLYKAEKVDGKWQSTGLIEGNINNPEFNTGNAVISEDGRSMFFTRSRKNWQNEFISEIFISHSDDYQWQTPQKLPYPINREDYTATQPALGKNLRSGKDIVYFVSDRPGGKGGMDIWYTEYDKKTDTYKNPVDLSNKVNSPGDECSPFYDISTQTLYFSSSGRKNGLGGYDIYKAIGSAIKWTDAVPLPKPLNSSFDDYYFSIMKSNKEGFFSSNRPGSFTLDNGTCCDDIFSFFINECVKIYSWGTVRNAVNYDFYDNLNEKYHLGLKYPENNSTIPDVPVELYLSDEKENDEILIGRTTTDKDGIYNFGLETDKHYKVLVKNYGYFEKKVSVSTFNIFCSDTIDIGTTFINYLPKITIQLNIYYDFDKYKLSDTARQTIDTMVLPLFDIFPNGIVEIGSHTDNKGTDEYNIKLSQKRSESVVSYLISKGISQERLVAKGYGMRNPIAQNTNKDGSDNPEGRQLNRRTEFKIVGEISKFNKDE